MKKLSILISLLLCGFLAYQAYSASPGFIGAVESTYVAPSGGILYCTSCTSDGTNTWLLCEDYEDSNACGDGSHTNCWCGVDDYWDTPDFNDTGIEGTYSLELVQGDRVYYGFAATSPVYIYARLKFPTLQGVGNDYVFKVQAGATVLVNIKLMYDTDHWEFRIIAGDASALSDGTFVVTQGTTLNIWFDYTAENGGGDAVGHLYVTDGSTKPAVDAQWTTGDVAGTPDSLYVYSVASGHDITIDRLRINNADITGLGIP